MTYSDDRLSDQRVSALQAELAAAAAQNQRLVATLREARDQIVALKEEVDRLAEPPSGYGVFLELFDDGSVDVFTSGRKMRVVVSPNVEAADLRPGQEVMLNEAMNVVAIREFERHGEIVMLKEILEDGARALVIGHTGFLVSTRRLAEGTVLPPRRTRPAKGAYGEDYELPSD